MNISYSEDALIERPAIALFGQLGWETINCFDEIFGDGAAAGPGRPYLGRETPAEVVLRPRLAAALARLNPNLPTEALALAVEELARDRSALSMGLLRPKGCCAIAHDAPRNDAADRALCRS